MSNGFTDRQYNQGMSTTLKKIRLMPRIFMSAMNALGIEGYSIMLKRKGRPIRFWCFGRIDGDIDFGHHAYESQVWTPW